MRRLTFALLLALPFLLGQSWGEGSPTSTTLTDYTQAFTYSYTGVGESSNLNLTACDKPRLTINGTNGVSVYSCVDEDTRRANCSLVASASGEPFGPTPVNIPNYAKVWVGEFTADSSVVIECVDVRNQVLQSNEWIFSAGAQGGAAPVLAPGVVESTSTAGTYYGTFDFFKWLGQQHKHPYPEVLHAAPQRRKELYCSCGAGGDYPDGNDLNDGRNPSSALRTFGTCLKEATNDGYTLVRVDQGDTWDIASGCFDGFGTMDDTNLVSGNCKRVQDDGWAAVANEGCWILESSNDEMVVLDGTGRTTPNDAFLRFQPVVNRSHLVMNGFDIIADNPDAAGFTTVPFDCFQGGMVSFFTKNGAVAAAVGSSGNLASCHEVCGTFIYGLETLRHTGTGSTGSSDSLGTQGGCTFAVYGSNGGLVNHTDSANTPESILATIQDGSAPDASLAAEMAATKACAVVSGLEMQVRATATNVNPVVRIGSTTSGGASNETETYILSSYLNNQSNGGTSGGVTAHTGVTSVEASGSAKLWAINTSNNNTGAGIFPRGLDMQQEGSLAAESATVDIEYIGSLHGDQVSGARDSAINTSRFFGSASIVKWREGIYHGPPGVPNAWRTPGCISQTPEEMQTCSDAQRVGAIQVSGMTNATTTSQQVGGGYCIKGESCENYRTGTGEEKDFCERARIPPWLTGGVEVRGHKDDVGPVDAGRLY